MICTARRDRVVELLKLKVAVAGNSFEAEGQREVVIEQFRAWGAMISSAPIAAPPKRTQRDLFGPVDVDEALNPVLARVFAHDAKRSALTLKLLPEVDADAVLLVLYGLTRFMGVDDVSGTRLMQSLKLSGASVTRIDRAVETYRQANLVIKSGY